MFERFTQRARKAVETAQRYAEDGAAREIRPDHLLEAVLADRDALATRVLADAGAPAEQLVAELRRLRSRYVDGLDDDDAEALQSIGIDLEDVVRRMRSLGGAAPARHRPRLARTTRKALELSLREALALRHGYIGTEHLLLGLVRCDDRVVTAALTAFEVAPETLRASVAEAVRKAG